MTDEKQNLNDVRVKINELDNNILDLLAKRRKLSLSAIKAKANNDIALRDRKREQELLKEQLKYGKHIGLDAQYISRLYHEIIDDSVKLQTSYVQHSTTKDFQKGSIRVAVQGRSYSSGRLAAEQHFAHITNEELASVPIELQACNTYKDCVDLLTSNEADYAMLPIENTLSGAINESYEILMQGRCSIVGEEKIKLSYVLMGLNGQSLKDIRTIVCTPHTISVCSRFLNTNNHIKVEALNDPSALAERIKDEKLNSHALIAPKALADSIGLDIIDENVANQQSIYARYLVLGRKPVEVDFRIPSKTSLVISTGQEPGALVNLLVIFQEQGIALTKLESRPVADNPGEELFYIDFDGNIGDAEIKFAVEELTKKAKFLKVLGSYPKHDTSPTKITIDKEEILEESISDKKEEDSKKEEKQSTKLSKTYRLASREYKEEDTVLDIGGVKLGGDSFVIIGGPCSVENKEQIDLCAEIASSSGVDILRGGCFKPRTSPYSFQGLGYPGLHMLVEAGKRNGMPVVTEVLAPEDVEEVAKYADVIQIGARNMQNFSLLNEVGKVRRPVMLKRGMSASITELLQAAEYILSQGNQQVFLCERGIRTFETATRSTLDLSAIPVLKQRTHLPIIVDPSHAAGVRELVIPLALASKAVGAHGIMVEFHPEPSKALSDGPQALFPEQFKEMVLQLR